ncbi:MAG: phosphatidate cytidylyltransferase [Rickettsiales bacterium]|jgi:predicted CDP-diglyceride synthetase/phosphatidate cytidylyltransferase|nr:phosphatidate cytidylyltransferase [Rickettsiales bacterium]
MVEDELKKSGLSRIYGWLRNRIGTGHLREWRNYLPAVSYLVFMFVSALYFRNLCIFLILGLCVHVARKTAKISENCHHNRIYCLFSYLYTMIPSFSMLYIVNLKNPTDLIVWLFLLLLTIRVSTNIFESIFEGEILSDKLHPSRTTMGFIGSLLVSMPIGLISSLFLKQKLIRFTLINMSMALLTHLQDVLGYRLGKYLESAERDPFIENYNGLSLVTSFLAFLILFKFIKA